MDGTPRAPSMTTTTQDLARTPDISLKLFGKVQPNWDVLDNNVITLVTSLFANTAQQETSLDPMASTLETMFFVSASQSLIRCISKNLTASARNFPSSLSRLS